MITIPQILQQAQDTFALVHGDLSDLSDEEQAEQLWEFAFATYQAAAEEAELPFTLAELEAAFLRGSSMDTIVNAVNCTPVDLYALATEASTLGLKPGVWPELLDTTLGNGRPFVRGEQLHAGHHDEFFAGYLYKQELGVLRLRVFND